MQARIEARLTETLAPQKLEVINESQKHAGHASAPPGGNSHFQVTVVAEAFAGLSRIERHRKVYKVLDALRKEGIHALAIRAMAPGEE